MVSTALIQGLTAQRDTRGPDIVGAVANGQKLTNNRLQNISLRDQIAADQTAQRRQEEIQRIIALTPPDQRGEALMQAGDIKTGLQFQRLQHDQTKFGAEQEQYQREQAELAAQQQRQNAFFSTLPPDQQALAQIDPGTFTEKAIGNVFKEAKPAQTRTIKQGSREVTQEWNPETGQWTNIADAPRWAPQRPGTTIYDPNTGNPIATIGGGAVNSFGKTTKGKVEVEAFNAANSLARLNAIEEGFDPRFLNAGTKIWATYQNFLDKFNAGTASPEEQAFLDDMSGFYSDAFNNLNTTLKELSGGAVTPQEAERLKQDLPNPGELSGTSFLEGDGPRKFAAKLKRNIRRQKLALARYSYYANTGRIEEYKTEFAAGKLPSIIGAEGRSGVDRLMQRRGEELADLYRSQHEDATDDEVFTYAAAKIREEFGL